MSEFNPWNLTSGLVDEFTATVQDAYFAFDPEYNDGETLLLKLEVQSDDSEVGRDGDGSDTLMYPAGKGWETGDKGVTARHESGKPRNFNKASGVGLLVGAALEADGLRDIIMGRGTPMEAAIWKGLELDFKRKEFSFKTDDGTEQSYARMLVVGGREAGGKGKGKAKAATPAAKADADEGESDGAKIPAKVKLALKKLAGEVADHDEFVERALTEVDGVEGNDAIEAQVMDEDWFSTLIA